MEISGASFFNGGELRIKSCKCGGEWGKVIGYKTESDKEYGMRHTLLY